MKLVKIWRPMDHIPSCGPQDHNFGDLLGLWIARRILGEGMVVSYHEANLADFREVILPIGTVIGTTGAAPHLHQHFWGCGWSGVRRVAMGDHTFHAVRGPHTRAALGLDCPIGDPGLQVGRWLPGRPGDEPLHIPHLHHRRYHLAGTTSLDPIIHEDDLDSVLDRIRHAGIVICGAMHYAIVAAGMGVPFAFHFPPGTEPEFPFKYMDFCASIGIPFVPVADVREAWAFWKTWGGKIQLPNLDKLMESFPR